MEKCGKMEIMESLKDENSFYYRLTYPLVLKAATKYNFSKLRSVKLIKLISIFFLLWSGANVITSNTCHGVLTHSPLHFCMTTLT